VQKNQGFAAFFYSELSRRLDAFAEDGNPSGIETVLRLRVNEARCADAIFIDGASTIEDIIDVSGVPRTEVLRILDDLLDQDALSIAS